MQIEILIKLIQDSNKKKIKILIIIDSDSYLII